MGKNVHHGCRVKLVLWLYCRSSGNEIVRAYAKDHYFDVVTNVIGLAAAVLGDQFYWWIDPIGAIILAVYTITNWSGTVLENAVSLMSQSASPEMLQKLTYLVLRHHPKINRVDTVRAYTFGVLYFVEECPYAVVCYQIFYDNGVISIVMEYMDGGSLADFLKKVKSIPERYLTAICKQVLKGLVYLHGKHIIHRDLKPSNILINHRGDVKITDFGVSVVSTSTSGHQGTFIGTLSYMSPERIKESIYGSKSDIWSLGLVFLELAQGQFPYPRFESFFELLDTVVNEPAPQASPEMFSPEFCSFISACLQKDPNERSTAQVLLEHPFLNKYDELNMNLASYFSSFGRPLATF